MDGEVDAIYAHTPYLETALVRQGAVEFVDQAGGEVPELAGRQIYVMLATREYVDQDPRRIEKLTRAIYKAQQLIPGDIDRAVNALAESGVQGLDQELVRTIVEIYSPALALTPKVSAAGILMEHRMFPDYREAPSLAGIDLSLSVAPQFAETVVSAQLTVSPIFITLALSRQGNSRLSLWCCRSVPTNALYDVDRDVDIATSLEQGADDFVVKPFSTIELLARIQAVTRRRSGREPSPGTAYSAGDLTLDPAEAEAFVRGERVHMTQAELEILGLLIQRAGRVVTTRDLCILINTLDQTLRIWLQTVSDNGTPQRGRKPESLRVV